MFYVFYFRRRILHLQVLVSEFVLGISGGDVVLWPQDLTLQLATGGVPFSNKRLGCAEEGSKLMLEKCIDFE